MRHLRIVFCLLSLFLGACTPSDRAPTEAEMKNIVTQTYLQVNDDILVIADKCRTKGGMIVNPLEAIKCTSVCSFDPKECRQVPQLSVTDFKKLACEKAVGQPGWVCDYTFKVEANSKFLMDMFVAVYGESNSAQARFLKTDDGQWVMMSSSTSRP